MLGRLNINCLAPGPAEFVVLFCCFLSFDIIIQTLLVIVDYFFNTVNTLQVVSLLMTLRT